MTAIFASLGRNQSILNTILMEQLLFEQPI